MSQRFNLYDLPHKALRNALGQLNIQFGNTDYNQEKELESLKQKMKGVMALLDSHSHIEDVFLIDELENKGIDAFEKDRADHNALDELLLKVSNLLFNISHETEDAIEQGRQVYLNFNQFHGRYLMHMHHEETHSLPIVLENMSDEDLMSVREKVMETTPPKLMQDWFYYCLPAQSHLERFMVLSPIARHYPKDMLEKTLKTAQLSLTGNDYKRLIAALSSIS